MGSLCSICAETNPAFTASGASVEENAEKAISLAEKKCPISKKTPDSIKKSITSEAVNGRLSLSQVKRAGGGLGLDREELQNPDSATMQFLSSITTHDDDYDEKLMLVSSVLISNSSNKEKAHILFETFDVGKERMLKDNELRNLLSISFDASVKSLPQLAISSSKMLAEGIKDYISKLEPCRERFLDTYSKEIMKGQVEVGQARFMEIINGEFPQLVNSSGIRCDLYKRFATKSG